MSLALRNYKKLLAKRIIKRFPEKVKTKNKAHICRFMSRAAINPMSLSWATAVSPCAKTVRDVVTLLSPHDKKLGKRPSSPEGKKSVITWLFAEVPKTWSFWDRPCNFFRPWDDSCYAQSPLKGWQTCMHARTLEQDIHALIRTLVLPPFSFSLSAWNLRTGKQTHKYTCTSVSLCLSLPLLQANRQSNRPVT